MAMSKANDPLVVRQASFAWLPGWSGALRATPTRQSFFGHGGHASHKTIGNFKPQATSNFDESLCQQTSIK
jgi:hypothetical protein